VILATSRLVLREAQARDAPELAGHQRDCRYLEHYAEPPDAVHIVERARQWASERPRVNYQLIITLAVEGSVIGCGGLRQAGYPPGEAEIGIEVHPDYWGFGYAREALSRLIDFARDDLSLSQLSALTTPTNRRAHSLLQNMGFSSRHRNGRFRLALAAV